VFEIRVHALEVGLRAGAIGMRTLVVRLHPFEIGVGAFEIRVCALAFRLRTFEVGMRAFEVGMRAGTFGGYRFVQLAARRGCGFRGRLLGLEPHARRFGDHLLLDFGAGGRDF
jgi:hypothetical protein